MKKLTIITGSQGVGKTDYANKITKDLRTHWVSGKDVTVNSAASKTPYDCLVWDEFAVSIQSFIVLGLMLNKIKHIIVIGNNLNLDGVVNNNMVETIHIGDDFCKLCQSPTRSIFTIDNKEQPICKFCAKAIFMQQAGYGAE